MSIFQFKHFSVQQKDNAMKVGTDSMLLGAFVETENKTKCLDVGAGTGVLSLMVAQRNTEIEINAVEIDELSAEECKLNFKGSKWANRLSSIHTNIFDFSPVKRYDLIVSNPPFYDSTLLNKDKRKATARHSEFMELKSLAVKIQGILSPNGCFWVIIPNEFFVQWNNEFMKVGVKMHQKINIKGKASKDVNRVIVCFGSEVSLGVEESTFVIRNEDNSYTKEYIELTKDFHSVDLSK